MHPFYPRAGVRWDDNEVDELLHWIQNGMSTYDFSLARGRSHSSVILRFALCYDEGLIEIICHRELHPNRFQYNIDDITI